MDSPIGSGGWGTAQQQTVVNAPQLAYASYASNPFSEAFISHSEQSTCDKRKVNSSLGNVVPQHSCLKREGGRSEPPECCGLAPVTA
jgi:hypothetical protein